MSSHPASTSPKSGPQAPAPAASAPAQEIATGPIDLSALPAGAVLPVTLTGTTAESEVSHTPCLYSEWVTGQQDPATGEWSTFRTGASATDKLQIQTAHGVLTLMPAQLRLHLTPAWTGENEGDKVAEYRLVAGKTYYAQVQVEGHYLPPAGPGEKPSKTETRVLALAESAWQGGAPTQPLTPRGKLHTY